MTAGEGGPRVPFLDLSRQTAALADELREAIEAVLGSGRFILGERVAAFERGFAHYCGVEHCVGVASGTDALALALRAAGVEPGDEVITSAFTPVPTAAAIVSIGAVPVLVDVDPATLTLDPAALEPALGPRTRAILPVHLYGQCAEMGAIADLARARGLAVIEDAAQAHGAECGGRRAGALADAAAFSFYPTKNLGALGDAGAVVTEDAELAERVRLLREQGEGGGEGATARSPHSRLDELQAAILHAKLPRLDRWNDRRRAIADRYLEELADTGLELPHPAEGRRHAFHLFVVRSPARDELRASLAARGIQTAVHYPRAIHQHPAYSELSPKDRSLERSERAAREVLSLPLYSELSDEEVASVVAAVRASTS